MNSKHTTVAVIGRPNVGKSTLFNRLVKQRRAIVADVAGVTRDRLYADISWNGKSITLIDTGGLNVGSDSDEISTQVKKQIFSAIEQADFVIFLVDGKDGLTSQDGQIASYLRKIKDKKKIFLAVNKIDTEKQTDLLYEFYSLGLGEPYPISALSGSSALADILDEISSATSEVGLSGSQNNEEGIKVAIVGKPNVGKSSILNCLTNEERSIVTSSPGTTRDSVNSVVHIANQDFVLIDTAGLRRKSKVSSSIERYATMRAVSAIEVADVVLLVIDATDEVSDQDQKIASLIKRRAKPSVILVNKWDLIENKTPNSVSEFEQKILFSLHFIGYSRILFTVRGIPWNASKEQGVENLFAQIVDVYNNYQKRISTSKLNKIIEDIVLLGSPPARGGKSLRIYFATQANTKPPEIVLFVNDSRLINEQYKKFLEREIRKKFDFSGSPIKLVFRNKRKD